MQLQIESRRQDSAPTIVAIPLSDAAGCPSDASGDSDISEALCLRVLESLRDSLAELTHASHDGAVSTFGFQLRSVDGDGHAETEWSEAGFCEQAARFESLHPALHAYAVATGNGAHGSRMWADAETPAGTAAMRALVERDRAWIPAYVEFLRSCDMDHEVDQWGDMDAVVERYGWQPDTCALAAARLASCHGQHGEEQFSSWLDAGLREYIDTREGRAAFLAAAEAEFDADSPQRRRHLALAREAFCDDADFWLDFFAPVLEEAELDALRRHAHARWDRSRASAA
ncbi:hypothetical protein [Luteimonas kalidii]|uniref:DUF4375 domain-containing protein n=1 Tax=Luteimonas kalidii TaxID=3042025 RepID=A0ABT6JS36_9GAMM|nr:hypothetical protein [Luteimonas kalidii]MDH5833417.1 hypothetical protein [Luteimonas kalidii]